MSFNITPLTPTQVVLNLASANQETLQKISQQVSSGYKYSAFNGYAEEGATEKFLSFHSTLSSIKANIAANNSSIARAKTADSSIAQIQGYANSLAALITQKNNDASGLNVPLTSQAQGLLDNIAGVLNINFEGRFLFSGSKTDTPPVVNIQASNVDLAEIIPVTDDSYYQGDTHIFYTRSSDAGNIPYGILANDQAFKDLIGAAHIAITAEKTNSTDTLNKALDMVNLAIGELASTRALGQVAIGRMTRNNSALQDTQLLVQGNLDTLSKTDIVQATAQMSSLQAIVQAGYMAYSRLSSLQLLNYLK